jgi:DNA-binding NarL/FixJ family response regulator
MGKIRILLADDHAVLRAGLKLLIDSQTDMLCVGEAGNGEETLHQVEKLHPDVLLLDITMPGRGGLDIVDEVRRRSPCTRILILTMHAEEAYLEKSLAAGAAGYVLKQAVDQELLNAIRATMRGEVYIHPAMTKKLLGRMLNQPGSEQEGSEWALSDREAEVIKQVARGYTNKEIADRLFLSVKTVETYRARAMRKLGLNSRAALVRYALKKGWLEEENQG